MPKPLTLFGRTFTIHGSPKDDYYKAYITDGVAAADPVLAAIRPHVTPTSVCIDVGANIGIYTLALAALAPQGRVLAFEPSPPTFSHLEANVTGNDLDNAAAFMLALGNQEGTAGFNDFPFFSAGGFVEVPGMSLPTDSVGGIRHEVPCTSLDAVLTQQSVDRVDVIKIDVEGAELSVLEGAADTLARSQPIVVLEFNSVAFALHEGIVPQVALARLRAIFPFLYVIGRNDGALAILDTGRQEYEFLYDNGVHGPADNLVASFSDIGVTEPYTHLGTMRAAANFGSVQAELQATQVRHAAAAGEVEKLSARVDELERETLRLRTELETVQHTLSWRVTAPLRRLRAFGETRRPRPGA